MRGVIPVRKIYQQRKIVIVLLVIIFMYCTMVSYDYNDVPVTVDEKSLPAINESELLRIAEERALPQNVIPNLHSFLDIDNMYITTNRARRPCTFPYDINATTHHYEANITETDIHRAEKTVFKGLTRKVKKMTRQANARLQEILRVDELASAEDLYHRNEVVPEPTVTGDMGIDLGSHLYFPGGHFIPLKCIPKWKVAIIIPYRNRSRNLNILLKNLVPFLMNQDLEFGIILAEQGYSELMNRGLMKNIGYQMAKLSGTKWDCFIFHDVDYVPMNSTNYYGCDFYPKHYATKLEEFEYDNPYMEDFGGVVGLTGEQIEKINGYSNMYWGWGGEDSDLSRRVIASKLTVNTSEEGYYLDLPHQKKTKRESCPQRFCLLAYAAARIKIDGITKLRYENSANISLSTLFTTIRVDAVKQEWSDRYVKCKVYTYKEYYDHFFDAFCLMCFAGLMVFLTISFEFPFLLHRKLWRVRLIFCFDSLKYSLIGYKVQPREEVSASKGTIPQQTLNRQ